MLLDSLSPKALWVMRAVVHTQSDRDFLKNVKTELERQIQTLPTFSPLLPGQSYVQSASSLLHFRK